MIALSRIVVIYNDVKMHYVEFFFPSFGEKEDFDINGNYYYEGYENN
jgi:hypothetical protein